MFVDATDIVRNDVCICVYICCVVLFDEPKKDIERDRERPKKETESESSGRGERWD